MKIKFNSRLDAIDWIANYAEDEGKFEVLREQLNYHFIYFGDYTLDLCSPLHEVALLDQTKPK